MSVRTILAALGVTAFAGLATAAPSFAAASAATSGAGAAAFCASAGFCGSRAQAARPATTSNVAIRLMKDSPVMVSHWNA